MRRFNSNASSTYKPTSDDFELGYGTGEVYGAIAKETVSVIEILQFLFG